MMLKEIDLRPIFAGVVYSPGWAGWEFYPEERLFVGITGTGRAQTYIRSVLQFPMPELPTGGLLVNAFLRVRIVQNEPLNDYKHICLREVPGDPRSAWSIDDELRRPILADHHLSTEIGLDLDFDLAGTVGAWMTGESARGLLLNLGAFNLGLVAFSGLDAKEPEPLLKVVFAVLPPGGRAEQLSIAPDTSGYSPEYPPAELLVKNLGPGLAWISPEYGFGREPLVDPAGIPLGVLEPGGYMIVVPRLPAKRLAIRIDTALTGTSVLVAPLSG